MSRRHEMRKLARAVENFRKFVRRSRDAGLYSRAAFLDYKKLVASKAGEARRAQVWGRVWWACAPRAAAH